MKLKKSKYLHNVETDCWVILEDDRTGEWIKIHKEWMDILDKFLIEELDEKEALNRFEDNEDKEYFEKLITLMKKKKFLIPVDEEEKAHIEQVYIAVTNNCNLKCKHCCYDASALNEKKCDLSTIEVKSIFDKVIGLSPDCIAISGGEPLVREDIIELLTYLRQQFQGKITLSSNAILITEKNVNAIYDLVDSFDISIDGVDEETCSRIRGKGVFDKVINIINMIKNIGDKRICLSMVDIEKNKKIIDKFYELNKELGTIPVVRYFYALGRGVDLQKELQVHDTEYDVEQEVAETETIEEVQKYMLGNRCGAGKRQFIIDYDGRIYPCGMLIKDEYCMGNIFEIENIGDYLEQDFKVECLRPWNAEKCKECQARLFCYNCLGEYDILQQNGLVEDKLCCRKENIIKIMEAL